RGKEICPTGQKPVGVPIAPQMQWVNGWGRGGGIRISGGGGGLMKRVMHVLFGAVAILGLALANNTIVQAQSRIGIEDRFADVNGVRLHYLIAGEGDPVILLHGYTQTSRMWRPLMLELAKTHTVIAP